MQIQQSVLKRALPIVLPLTLLALAINAAAQTNATPALAAAESTPAADDAAELAKKLSNPVASLISVPFQNNFDFGGGPGDNGFQYKLNVQPVIPATLTEDWNLITRVILPYIHQSDRIGTSSQTGFGDTLASFFFSPKEPTQGGLIWGVGPVLYLPTATDSLLGAEKWGSGPTGLLLWQKHKWTYGALVNHVWSFAGESGRPNVNSTFLQPFLAYQVRRTTTLTVNSETTYDWENRQWTMPVNGIVSELVRIGKLPVSLQFGARYYLDKPAGGPDWGLRFAIVLVFPK